MSSSRCVMVLLCLVVLASSRVALADLFGVNSASKEVHAAIKELNEVVNRLPAQLQDTIGVNIKLLGSELTRILDEFQTETVPVINDAVVTDMDHLGDVVRALAGHLVEIEGRQIETLDQDAQSRITQLMARLREIQTGLDHTVGEWIDLGQKSVVRVEAEAERIIVRATDRVFFDVIRFVSVSLFLIGLLMIGLQLLRVASPDSSSSDKTRRPVVDQALAWAFLGCFLLVSLSLSLRPGLLAEAAARVSTHSRETACERLEKHKTHLAQATAMNSPQLVAATQRRIDATRVKCFDGDTS